MNRTVVVAGAQHLDSAAAAIRPLVLTFLSRTPSSSRRTQELLRRLVGLRPVPLPLLRAPSTPPASTSTLHVTGARAPDDDDVLSRAVFRPNYLPLPLRPILKSYHFDSAASVCAQSGTVLHFLSVGRGACTEEEEGKEQGGGERSVADDGDADGAEAMENELTLLAITAGPGAPSAADAAAATDAAADVAPQTTAAAAAAAVAESRRLLTNHVRHNGAPMLGPRLALRQWYDGGGVAASPETVSRWILGSQYGAGLPLLDLSTAQTHQPSSSPPPSLTESSPPLAGNDDDGDRSRPAEAPCRLRELAIPHFADSTYPDDGTTLLGRLASCPDLTRSKVGLYTWSSPPPSSSSSSSAVSGGGLTLRPLPAAEEDRHLPSPTLVFQCADLDGAGRRVADGATSGTNDYHEEKEEEEEEIIRFPPTATAKVGYSGNGRSGQLMVLNPLLTGLDVRLCESTELSPYFAEAQEALLAASLDELQNVNVVSEGGGGGPIQQQRRHGQRKEKEESKEKAVDAMNGLGDCWVEFRANVRSPSGYLRKMAASLGALGRRSGSGRGGFFGGGGAVAAKRSPSRGRVAKAPDIPYQ